MKICLPEDQSGSMWNGVGRELETGRTFDHGPLGDCPEDLVTFANPL